MEVLEGKLNVLQTASRPGHLGARGTKGGKGPWEDISSLILNWLGAKERKCILSSPSLLNKNQKQNLLSEPNIWALQNTTSQSHVDFKSFSEQSGK